MASDPLFYVVVAACLLVLFILLWGVGSFGRGGEYNKRNANNIMRYRLGAQFVAILLILLFIWVRSKGA